MGDILDAKPDWPDGIAVVQKQGTASLAINVPQIEMAAGVATQIDAVDEALKAAYRLMEYASLFSR